MFHIIHTRPFLHHLRLKRQEDVVEGFAEKLEDVVDKEAVEKGLADNVDANGTKPSAEAGRQDESSAAHTKAVKKKVTKMTPSLPPRHQRSPSCQVI